MKKIYKSQKQKMIAGVCSGIANYVKVDPTFVRLLFIFICLFTGIVPMLIAYLIAAIIIPFAPNDYQEPNVKKLYRSKDRKIAGIFGGISKLLKIDPTILRVIAAAVCLLTGVIPLLIAYLIGWVVIPESPYDDYVDITHR
ncbi:MAG TPA: PspC domain-containing protein [Chlamydiales bacterium]|nr:PspC domain-containing protein [Chlamydiales bacterium]